MNIERDKFLTEAIGECWHEIKSGDYTTGELLYKCKCGFFIHECGMLNLNDFSTPDGFFKLWEWAQKQGWWIGFCLRMEHIHPDRFANAVYEYLKEDK